MTGDIKEKIKISQMTTEHLQQVFEIESDSFALPWSREALEEELVKNKLAFYFVAEYGAEVVGYIGLWHVINEGHITNIAVKREMRRMGVADRLISSVIERAWRLEMIGITLEVRVGNRAAMNLYCKHGFKVEGIRKNYYSDTKEDAVIMWKYL